MLTRSKAKEIIKRTVKSSIVAFVQKNIKKKPKFQVLDLIIPKERKIRSIIQVPRNTLRQKHAPETDCGQ